MGLEINGEWSNGFKHDGMLYFAQRIEEMLYHYTNHLYKVPILNTVLLIKEYLTTANLVKKKVIEEEHLKYILEEFKDTFANDIIIKHYLKEEKTKAILQKLNESSSIDQERLMHYLMSYLSEYNIWCKNYMNTIVRKENEKKKIDKALRSYLPGLIGCGYSQEHIYFYCKKIFKEDKVESLNSLTTFLNHFDFMKHKYIVYVPIDRNLEQFRSIIEKRIHVNFDVDTNEKKLKCDRKKYRIVSLEETAFDEKKAAEQAYQRLDIFIRYYKFIADRKEEMFYNKGMVKDEDDNYAFVDLKPVGYNYDANYDQNKLIGKISETIITSLLKTGRKSFPTIDKCVRLHDLAIETTDLKNSFLNFWSILEIICVINKNKSKTTEIENAILPVLKKDYISLTFQEIDKYLKDCLDEKEYSDFLNSIGDGTYDYVIAKLITLDTTEEYRKNLYDKLENYPLIRSRISQLHELYNTKKGMLNDVTRYATRVKWHLKRLYRTRNSIVHSGDEPDNLKLLGEHLHSYVDEILNEIAIKIAICTNLHSIDNVLIDAQFTIDNITNTLNSKDKFEENDLKIIFELH